MFFLITSTNVLQMAQGNSPAHQRSEKVVNELKKLKENQILLMATLAQRDAEVEKLNKILVDEEFLNRAAGQNNFVSSPVYSCYFFCCQVGIADPTSVSSGSNTQGYIMDVPVRLQILLLTSLE